MTSRVTRRNTEGQPAAFLMGQRAAIDAMFTGLARQSLSRVVVFVGQHLLRVPVGVSALNQTRGLTV